MPRPSFTAAWAASTEIYGSTDPGAKVAKTVGGLVAHNILNLPPGQRWENTCAVRMSYILNKSGMTIPHLGNKTVSGANRRQYFYRVPDLIEYLTQRWGKPDLTMPYPPSGGGQLGGKKGIILFEVSGWSNARGHATLWNGSICYDHCYFNEPGANYRTERANFWSLP